MLGSRFKVKDGELGKTPSLVSLTLLSAQLHASRAPKINSVNGSLYPTSPGNTFTRPGDLHTLRLCLGRWFCP